MKSGLIDTAPYSSTGLGSGSGFSAYGSGPGYDLSLPQTSSSLLSSDLGTSGLGGTSSSSSAQKVSSYSSSYSSTSKDGGRPVVEYSKDSTYRSTVTGPTGVPKSSYAHSSASYSSEDPYKNRVSNYSYNI